MFWQVCNKMNPKLEKIDPTQFNYRIWEAGTIYEIIKAPCRYQYITKGFGKKQLKKYAIGWCGAERLSFKPKQNEVAIMCFKDGRYFWFHIRREEFDKIWRE